MTDNVTKVEPNVKRPEWRTVTVGEKDYIVFSAELADALKVGAPLPEGTTEEPPKFDGALPSLRLPRGKGFGGAPSYRNSKEAFDAEAKSRAAWQLVEEERRDKRTALMQAVEHLALVASPPDDVIRVAEQFYDWLRETSGSVAGESPNPPVEKPALDPGPDTSPAPSVGAGTPAGDGEAPAGREPGEESPAIGTSPGPTKGYPLAPEQCDHRARGGYWLKTQVVDGQARCPRCGLSALIYKESA